MKRKIEMHALDRCVLAVAVLQYDGDNNKTLFDWAVYIGAVPGENHEIEYMEVTRTGSKASKELATLLFPYVDIEKYRR